MSVTMHATPFLLPNDPRWQRQARPRLALSCLLATLFVAIVLAALRFPVVQLIQPSPEILVRLLPQIIEPLAELPAQTAEKMVSDPQPSITAATEAVTAEEISGQAGTAGALESVQDPPDWQGQIGPAAKAAVDETKRIVSVNPTLDAKRRAAAEKYYASRAPEKKEIWDNVETDQLGRKILWSGDCYRIIDDPSPANYDIWREFQQYFIYCKFGKSDPGMLPWVEGIQDRYLYLKYPNGEIPEDELRDYLER